MYVSRKSSSVPAHAYWEGAVRSLGVLLIAGLGLMACDSNGGGPPPSDLDGAYRIEEMRFTVSGVNNFNILADTLVADTTGPNTPRIEFFGEDATAIMIFRLEGSDARSSISGAFSTAQGRVNVDFSSVSEENRFGGMLPPRLRLQLQNDASRLVANQDVQKVDLRDYSPGRYGGLTQPVNGTLRMELERLP
jgi:hypothetical protein